MDQEHYFSQKARVKDVIKENGDKRGEGSMSFHFPSTSMSKAKQPSYGIGQ